MGRRNITERGCKVARTELARLQQQDAEGSYTPVQGLVNHMDSELQPCLNLTVYNCAWRKRI